MRQKPITILLASLVFLSLPVELLWRAWHFGNIFWIEWLVSFVFPIVLWIGLVRVTRTGWYSLMGCLALWGVHDLYEAYAISEHPQQILTHLAIYVFSIAYFINPRVRTLYFDPKLHWWKTKPRYETNLPMIIHRDGDWNYPMLRNVSEGGCFIEVNGNFELNERIQIAIPLPVPLTVSVIQTDGEVRWISTNPLRRGMGVRFVDSHAEQTKAIRQFVRLQL